MGLRKKLGLEGTRFGRKGQIRSSTKKYRSVLTDFCSSLRGRDCIVFGSAPDPVLKYSGQAIICCNGSALSLERVADRAPDYTFLHCHVLARENPSDQEVREALKQARHLGRTVIFHESRYAYAPKLLLPKASDIAAFDWQRRSKIIESLLGSRLRFLDLSTGAMTAAAVLQAGARSVELVGFSFDRKGHSYNSNGRYRNHVRSDAALFALLGEAGYDISSRDPSIAMILTRKID